MDLHALVSSAIEFSEDEGLLKIVDARTAIGNADGECPVVVLGFRGDPRSSRFGARLRNARFRMLKSNAWCSRTPRTDNGDSWGSRVHVLELNIALDARYGRLR